MHLVIWLKAAWLVFTNWVVSHDSNWYHNMMSELIERNSGRGM